MRERPTAEVRFSELKATNYSDPTQSTNCFRRRWRRPRVGLITTDGKKSMYAATGYRILGMSAGSGPSTWVCGPPHRQLARVLRAARKSSRCILLRTALSLALGTEIAAAQGLPRAQYVQPILHSQIAV